MKKKILLAVVLLASALGLRAATNDLTSLLQQGLFDEEANHDLTSAIADYQSLATQFNLDRQVAATAIYRLGECYRKMGETNQAVSEYQRILKEFGEQKDLAMLSQQNLTGLGVASAAQAGGGTASASEFQQRLDKILANSSETKTSAPAVDNVTDANLIAAQLERLDSKHFPNIDERALAVASQFSDEILNQMVLHRSVLENQMDEMRIFTNKLTGDSFIFDLGPDGKPVVHHEESVTLTTSNLLEMAHWEYDNQDVYIQQRTYFIINQQSARLQTLRSAAQAALSLNVANQRPERIWIWGSVRKAGPIEIQPNENLTAGQAIMEAGGLGDFANAREVKVVRATPGTNEDKILILNMQQILEQGHTEKDIILKPGDSIIVASKMFNI